MEHLRPSSFADIMELLQEGSAKTTSLTTSNRVFLRENNSVPSSYNTRTLRSKFIIDNSIWNTNVDMQLSLNDNQFLDEPKYKASAGMGVDRRTISRNDIERVEIIRGIPSASYGDLTSGVIKIDRKIGKTSEGKNYHSSRYFKFVNNTDKILYADGLIIVQSEFSQNGLSVKVTSYKKQDENRSIWGYTSYQNLKFTSVKRNENLDYNRIAPYRIADSAGGDTKLERYQFSGGISQKIDRWTLGLEASYLAQIGSSNRDPRQKSTTSNLNINLGANYRFYKDLEVGVFGNLNKYTQSTSMKFVNDLNRADL
ncbi:MAG: DUF6850 family outer membrane beta-barrel protein, partial [Soonwooa sp.]